MASVLRYSAVAALVSSAAGAVIGAMPSQTMGSGFGAPIFALPLPTEGPSLELVKRRLEKKALTNICTEWTIPGGFGQPECGNSETCLFTSADGYYYEGCGQTSISYNWVTECWNYPQLGVAPISQKYCPESAPYCGFFAFVFGLDYTFWNFGCSTSPYSLYVDLLATTTGEASSPVVLAGGGTSQITPLASTVYVTQPPSSTSGTASVLLPPGATQNANSAPTSTSSPGGSSLPIVGSHSTSSTPTGAIVGGVIGGIALIAFLSFLLWFFLRKRKQDKALAQSTAQNEQQQADDATAAAFHNHNRIPEIGGTSKPASAYIPPPSPVVYPEKQTVSGKTTEVYRPQGQGDQSTYVENAHPGGPPPIYSQPQPSPSIPTPSSRYNELEEQRRAGGSQPSPSIPSPPSNYNELEEQRRMGSGPPVSPPLSHTGYLSPEQEQRQEVPELGGANRGSWNAPPGVQEMSGSTGGITRRPVGGARQSAGQWVDMSGAPMSEEFHSHELE